MSHAAGNYGPKTHSSHSLQVIPALTHQDKRSFQRDFDRQSRKTGGGRVASAPQRGERHCGVSRNKEAGGGGRHRQTNTTLSRMRGDMNPLIPYRSADLPARPRRRRDGGRATDRTALKRLLWRREWDSNPRMLSHRWISRPEPSTTRPSLHMRRGCQ